jgi:multimeric flavodoxin WrbA
MKVIGINGSPRKQWNTATLLEKALEGAASRGARTEVVHLYDLEYQGCRSCFGCKAKGTKSYGKCAMTDGLTPVLDRVLQADALVLASPIYFWAITGEMKSFLERLMFPYYRYVKPEDPSQTLFPRAIRTGFIYTMGAAEERMREFGYDKAIELNQMFLGRVFGASEAMVSCDTCHVSDYSRIDEGRFDPAAKAAHKERQFPLDCRQAVAMGARMAGM